MSCPFWGRMGSPSDPPDSCTILSPVPSDLQKLLEMVREDARRAIMLVTELQKKVPRYVPLIQSDSRDSHSGNTQLVIQLVH